MGDEKYLMVGEATPIEPEPPDDPVDVVDLARRFAALHAQRAAINKEFDELKDEVKAVLTAREVPSVTVGDKIVGLSVTPVAVPKGGNKEAMFDALEANEETAFLVERKANLGEWSKELPTDEETLAIVFPEHVRDFIEVIDRVSVSVRKRTKKVKGGA